MGMKQEASIRSSRVWEDAECCSSSGNSAFTRRNGRSSYPVRAAVASAGVFCAMLAGCKQAPTPVMTQAPVAVTVARVTVEDVPVRLQAIGSVQAISTVSMRALVSGELKTVGFHQGDEVRKGQTLFTIDPKPYEAALAQAQANLARDQATLNQAQWEARRYTELAKQGIVSAQQNEQIQATAASAASVVQADQAAVQTAKLNLSYCTIDAPISGRTGSLLVQAGNLVQPNSTVLVTVNQIAPIYVSFSVPQQYLQQLKTLQAQHPLEVTAQAQGDTEKELGTLSFINNTIDNTTGTIELMATFPNADERLWPGEYVNIEIRLSVMSNVTVVPSTAVLTGQDKMYVYLLMPNQTVKSQTVQTSISENGVTVVNSGLAPGQTVVTDGQFSLFPGASVQVRSSGSVAQTQQPGQGMGGKVSQP